MNDVLNRKAAEAQREELSDALNALSQRVIGAAIEVHRVLGPGFLEVVYEEALCIELELRGLRFSSQVPIAVNYKGRKIGEGRLDILVEGILILELKTVDKLAPIHEAQTLSYLKATGHQLGLLMNFNAPSLREGLKRIIRS